jgi:hypothetical protein
MQEERREQAACAAVIVASGRAKIDVVIVKNTQTS